MPNLWVVVVVVAAAAAVLVAVVVVVVAAVSSGTVGVCMFGRDMCPHSVQQHVCAALLLAHSSMCVQTCCLHAACVA